MKITTEQRQIINEHFDYTLDFKFMDLVYDIIDLASEQADADELYELIDRECTYYEDCWTILQWYFYSDISNVSWEQAIEYFTDDIFSIYGKITGQNI